MEIAESEEKFATIRQTIRRVILPLVQSIYEVDPPDIELFCSQFFESQLQKRESKEKDLVDGNSKIIEEFHDKNEGGTYNQKTEDDNDKIISSTTNIQGSASDPVLTGEKAHGVSLREASSWDITPNHPKLDGRRTDFISNLSDAICGVGDRPCHEKASVGDPEIDRKAGDEYSLPKEEDKILENENIIPSDEAVQVFDVFPSAPPYDDHNLKMENIEIGLENSENSDQEIEIIVEENNSTLKEKETNLSSHSVRDDGSCSYTDGRPDVEGLKTNSKTLSPNSSFGFIPNLNETCVKQETSKTFVWPKSWKDSDFEKGIDAEISDLSGQFSETLQDLAQKFNSAESNFDVELKNAKEICDVMPSRSSRANFKEENNFNIEKDNASISEKNDYKSSNVEVDFYVDENNNISPTSNTLDSNYQIQREGEYSIPPYAKNTKEDIEIYQHEEKSGTCKIKLGDNEVDIRKGGPELHQMKKDPFNQQGNSNDNKNRTNPENSRANVDEEWRKRWYEAHPCLDNFNSKLRQTPLRGQIGTEIYASAHTNPTANPIGEAGDVPPDLFRHAPQSNLTRNLRHLESNSRVERNVSCSPILEEHHSQEKPLTDAIQRRENTMATFNNLDKDITKTKSSNSFSNNVPYTWRKMGKQQARYLETEKQVLKQLQESCGEGAISKEKKSIENPKATHTQALHESLSEIIVEKQTNKSNYDNEANDESVTTRNNEQEGYEENNFKQNFKNKIYSKLQSSPLKKKNDLYKVDTSEDINLHASNIDDKSVKNFNTLIEEDSNTFKPKPKPKPCYVGNKRTAFENQNDPEDKHKDFNSYSACEKDTMLYRNDRAQKIDGCVKRALRFSSNEDVISEVKGEIRAYQRMDNSSKVEPGLHSAGGDFTSPNMDENEEQLNSPGYAEHNTSPGGQEVTVEYVEEIIERMMQPDSFSDSYEGLNFSSYSEDDSSDMESQYSDAEDSNLYTEMCEP